MKCHRIPDHDAEARRVPGRSGGQHQDGRKCRRHHIRRGIYRELSPRFLVLFCQQARAANTLYLSDYSIELTSHSKTFQLRRGSLDFGLWSWDFGLWTLVFGLWTLTSCDSSLAHLEISRDKRPKT